MNWDQLKTILWLRWRLTRNQLFRGSSIGGVLLVVLSVISLLLIGLVCGGATFGGYVALRNVKPETILLVWTVVVFAFLVVWTLGLLVELQRSETIDLQRLMHLPVRLGQVFVINYIASHATFALLVLVPAMLGLTLGLALGRSAMFLFVVPLLFSCVFMVTAWTYYLRGWLASLMTNPRRRRTVIMCFTLIFILLGQAPNLYFNVFRRNAHRPPANESAEERAKREEMKEAEVQAMWNKIVVAQKFIPPLWLPLGAKGAAEGNPLPALLGTVGCVALGALGLRCAYRSTVKYYHGETGKKSLPAPSPETTIPQPLAPPRHSKLIELRVPGVPEPAAAVAGATMRSMMRAPEVKMALGTSLIVVVILAATMFMRASPKMPDVAKPFIGTAAAAFTLFMLFQFVGNQFGLDRDGFRVLVLSPVSRKHLLLGKNLAMLPIVAGLGLSLILLLSFWFKVPVLTAVASLFQLIVMTLCLLLFANLLSILLPFRMQQGSMKPTKPPFLKMLGLIFCQMFFPLILAPAALPPLAELLWHKAAGFAALPLNLILSFVFAVLAMTGYWLALGPLANLYSSRELAILKSVTSEEE